jgi:4-amino-4-deoxy-L-arabinose transferase-like glycosyltransferase
MKMLRLAEALVVGVALATRVGALASVADTRAARFPQVDAATYWEQALMLAAGADPFPEGFYQPPGYPWFLAALGALTGRPELGITRLVQAGMGVATVGLLIWLGRRLGERLAAPWVGAVAGAVYALNPSALLFEMDILTPALTTLLLVAALFAMGVGDVPRPWRAALAGLCMGLAAEVHATFLAPAALLVAHLAWQRSTRMAATALAAGVFLGVAPTLSTNLVRFGQPTIVSLNTGINLYLGNNPRWRDTSFLRPGLPFRQLALEAEPDRRNQAERDRYWRDRAIAESSAHPDAWLGALATRLVWSVNNTEIPRNEDYRCRTGTGPLAWVSFLPARFGLVFPLAAFGAVATARRNPAAGRLLTLWFGLHLPMVLFLVADRYRTATWPLLALFAPLGAAALAAAFRAWRTERRASPAPLLLLPLAAVPWFQIDARTALQPAWCLHSEANLAMSDGAVDEAIGLYEQAVALDPHDIGAWLLLADQRARKNDVAGAAAAMEPVLAAFPDHYPSLMAMSGYLRSLGDVDGAIDTLTRAYRVPGERTNTGVRLVRLLAEARRQDEIKALLRTDPTLASHPEVRKMIAE